VTPSAAERRAGIMVLLRQKIGRDRTRVCNEQCYNAKSAECNCICGGKNHGVGEQAARLNVRDIFLPMIEAAPTGVLQAVLRQDKFDFGDAA
jgi:hypothetical protein